MPDPVLVSVVIPTYNYVRFVGEAIESALAQTWATREVIVVDDGSTDETPALLASYGSRIQVIRKPNGGLSSARNAGIRAARGECIALLDADDIFLPAKLERQALYLRQHPEAGAIGCGAEYFDGDGRPRPTRLFASASGTAIDRQRNMLLRKQWVGASGSGALIPRAVLDRVGLFDEALGAAEDWDLWLRIVAEYPVYNVPEPLVRIRLHYTGTFRNAQKMERNQWQVYRNALRRSPGTYDLVTRRRARALILADAAGERSFAGNHWSAAWSYLRSLAAWPFNRSSWYGLLVASARAAFSHLRPAANR